MKNINSPITKYHFLILALTFTGVVVFNYSFTLLLVFVFLLIIIAFLDFRIITFFNDRIEIYFILSRQKKTLTIEDIECIKFRDRTHAGEPPNICVLPKKYSNKSNFMKSFFLRRYTFYTISNPKKYYDFFRLETKYFKKIILEIDNENRKNNLVK